MNDDETMVVLLRCALQDAAVMSGVGEISRAVSAGMVSNFEGRVRTIARAVGEEKGSFRPITSKEFFELLIKVLPAIKALADVQNPVMTRE